MLLDLLLHIESKQCEQCDAMRRDKCEWMKHKHNNNTNTNDDDDDDDEKHKK